MKKSKFISSIVIGFLTLGLLAGCGAQSTNKATSNDQKWELKAGHVAASSHPMNTELITMAKQIEEKTKGRVKISVFPEATLGGEREMLEGAKLGTMDIVLATTAVTGNFDPKMKIFDLPFLFKDREQAIKVLDGPIGQQLLDGMSSQGLVGLSFWENGFRNLTNSKRPIEKPADIKGLKIRTMENPIHLDAWKALGASPTPMAFAEVFTALQQGTIDGQENPLAIISTSRLYEVQKYVALTKHNYSPMVLIISKKVWDAFPDDIKAIFKEQAMSNAKVERQMLKEADEKYIADMKKFGTVITTPDTTPFREMVKPVYDKYSKDIGEDIIKQILDTK